MDLNNPGTTRDVPRLFSPITKPDHQQPCSPHQKAVYKKQFSEGCFEGIFANASLFHVPGRELPRVLQQLHSTLKPDGVLFCSNPHGANI